VDISEVMAEIEALLDQSIGAEGYVMPPVADQGRYVDLSQIDFEKLKKEFAKVPRKNIALQDIRVVVEQKLKNLLSTNPLMMDYYRRYQELIAEYNREKDRATVEQTFAALVALAASLDEEQRRAVEEGLSPAEMAIFDLLKCENLTQVDREKVKQASRSLLARIRTLLAPMDQWTRNAQTQAEVHTSILDWLYESLPQPPFTESDTTRLAQQLYEYVWQQSEAGNLSPKMSVS